MASRSLGTWAEAWRRRLQHGVAPLSDLKRSADEQIRRAEAPPDWLLDVAVAQSQAEALSILGRDTGQFDEVRAFRGLVQGWRELFVQDRSTANRIGLAMYHVAFSDEFTPAEATTEMAHIGHDLDPSHQELFDRASLESDLLEFLERWADPEPIE